jgi:heme exporter protein D
MSPAVLASLEAFIVLGVALGLAIWQLVSVRREIARDRERERRQREAEGSAGD